MLRFRIPKKPRRLSSYEGEGSGPEGRLLRLRKIVTGLLRHERLELPHGQADEARGYAERLIQIAMKHGDRHPPTMELANYWVLEKDLLHKLFKVLVPRYHKHPATFTSMWTLPTKYPSAGGKMSILELRDNPWPPIKARQRDTKYLLSNVLLDAARHDYYQAKTRGDNTGSQATGGITQDDIIPDIQAEGEGDSLESDVKYSKIDNIGEDVGAVTKGLDNIDEDAITQGLDNLHTKPS